jgi:valine--pyruvate aminotransferase
MILTFSLSKLGLPGTRTGIVVADPQVIEAISAMSAITALANNNVGQMVTQSLFDSRKILSLSRDVIRPYYEQRARQARDWIQEAFAPSIPFRLHRSEGAFFLWLWLEDLPISSAELYRRLKRLGVLVISGHYFFFGLKEEWKHQHECLRISFTAPTEMLRRGIEILADEIQRVYEEAATESLASE